MIIEIQHTISRIILTISLAVSNAVVNDITMMSRPMSVEIIQGSGLFFIFTYALTITTYCILQGSNFQSTVHLSYEDCCALLHLRLWV